MSESIDLTKATVVVASAGTEEPIASIVLVEEIQKRSGVRLPLSASWPEEGPVIAICLSSGETLCDREVPALGVGDKPEGYRLFCEGSTLWIVGFDRRGSLYGVGNLLRILHLSEGRVGLPSPVDVATSPAYQIRGHQLGYRDTANTYDAWDVAQYDHYIRELAIFGTNAVENIPLQDRPNVLMKLPRREMNIRISEICEKYDIDYWVWTPAGDLTDPEVYQSALREHEELYRDCPRLNGIFFPGGDPGSNHPREVMPFLADLTEVLHRYHPRAGMWLSLQKFDREKVDYFFNYLNEEKPDWFAGVITGPSSPPVSMIRERLPERYRMRRYPDITHTIRCQFEVEWWDQAYALTLGREPYNPQPNFYSHIHNRFAKGTDGFSSYSDGAHDDVNKVIWSRRGWDPEADVQEIVMDYCRFFFGEEVAASATEGIFALERNWEGPLAENDTVERTLEHWRGLERENPGLSGNWRWQFCLLRANYDAYTRRRLIYERSLEVEAMEQLARIDELGIEGAMEAALATVNRAETEPVDPKLRNRIEELCEALFQSIGLQSSVEKYHASGSERGCVLDFVDYPLNNRWWLEDEFDKIREMESEKEMMERLEVIRTWEDPGPGSFYDDIGNIARSPRVERGWYPSPGFAWWDGGYSRTRLSSQVYLGLPKLTYEGLDPEADYTVRVAGFGEALLEFNGVRLESTVYNREEGTFKEFPVPRELTKNGTAEITFARPNEGHLNWRHRSRVSDVWLLKT
jgi:hypothetical protein